MTNTPENKPIGPFTLTPSRIILLAMGALALVLIIGAIMGGVGNYQTLRDARDAALSSSEEAASSQP